MLKVKDVYDYRRELCEALRSGKYTQGYGHASTISEDAPCAIGVARIIFGLQLYPAGVTLAGDEVMSIDYHEVARLLGLYSAEDLWSKNDALMWSFPAIADWLEKAPVIEYAK